jgi:excinuclease ABC subunit A
MQVLASLAKEFVFSLDTPWGDLTEEQREIVLHGHQGQSRAADLQGRAQGIHRQEGVRGRHRQPQPPHAADRVAWMREELAKYQAAQPCETCGGKRLNDKALSVKIAGTDISTPVQMSVSAAKEWFGGLEDQLGETQRQIARAILKEINERLGFLDNVGLDYLNLDRTSGTLSGGESQRIRLASQIGSGLSGVLYVLDEPSIASTRRTTTGCWKRLNASAISATR